MRKSILAGAVAGSALILVLLGLFFVLPSLMSRDFDQKSLERLKGRALRIRSEFAAILADHERVLQNLRKAPPLTKERDLFVFFKNLGLKTETEGVSASMPDGRLVLWLGNVVDLGELIRPRSLSQLAEKKAPFIIRDKASIFLVSIEAAPDGGYLTSFRLLAFIPRFQSSYLKEYHFLNPNLKKRCEIDYWNFQEDISEFERIFSNNKDEFVGQLRQKNEIRTLYFPLRGRDKRILATVTITSPSLAERSAILREDILLSLYLLLISSLIGWLSRLLRSPGFFREKRYLWTLLGAFVLAAIRFLFFPLSRLERIQSLSIFSPAGAGFFSASDLTRSPADIFLTSLGLLLLVGCLFASIKTNLRNQKKSLSRFASFACQTVALAAAFLFFHVFRLSIRHLIFNSNIPLLRFEPGWSFFLLHLSLLFFLATVLALIYIVLRTAAARSAGPAFSLVLLVPALAAAAALSGERFSLPAIAVQAAVIISILFLAHSPQARMKKEVIYLGFFLGALLLVQTVDQASGLRNRSLIQNFLKNAVLSQEQWGNLLVEESLPEIEKRGNAIRSFLKESGSPDFAHSIWEKTLTARFNWYSSLEILDPEGNSLSRFSLNIPKIYERELSLPFSGGWTALRRTLASLGRERDYLIAYKDWFQGDVYLGRTILYLSLDPDTLPFLYSANPYFELLRAAPSPSLKAVDFGLAVFDLEGRLLFNPQKIFSGISPDILKRLQSHDASLWSRFLDKSRTYHTFYFRRGNRIIALFTPRKSFRTLVVEFLKLFSLDLLLGMIFILPALLFKRNIDFKNILRSFSNRVYAAFFAVALIPLLLFTFFTRNLFDRIFAERFVKEAATRADVARSILEDFVSLQQRDRLNPSSPPEDLVLWVGATLANDINLYKDARLLSSTRREFFDAGLLPGLIDGEIAYELMFEKAPFYMERKKIGGYDFQTLTIPYHIGGAVYLISMPFPFEKQEAARMTGELVEFLFFLSLFFVGLIFVFSRGIRAMIVVPIRKLLEGTREVSLGNLEVSIEHHSRDEMKTLVEGFNAMVQSLKGQQQEMAEMSKKVAWAEMARKVAHEIKNPLTPIQLSAEHILKVFKDGSEDFETTLNESISYITSEVENLRKISQEFMEIARDTTLRKEVCDLKRILTASLDPFRKTLSARIRFSEIFEGEDFLYLGDEAKLRTVFRNIITNAVEAVHNRGEIGVFVRRDDRSFSVRIRDTGPGMEKKVLDKMFEPYFSTKDVGTGLGLPIARKIIGDHGGSIRAESEPGKGTAIIVDLPFQP